MTVAVSEELFAPVGRGVELCYQTFGEPDDDPLLLVMGLGGPITWWDPELCRTLADRGFFVVRFDNRDTGRSTRCRRSRHPPDAGPRLPGRRVRAPYSLADMAGDGVGLMDHLGLRVRPRRRGVDGRHDRADHGDRAAAGAVADRIMSTTGNRTVGWQHPRLLPTLMAPRGRAREEYVAGSVALADHRLAGLPDHRRRRPGARRGHLRPRRQPQRRDAPDDGDPHPAEPRRRLRALPVPTLVVHGLADRMVHVSGGRATATAIPGAELLLVDGMGHDLPPALFSTFVDAIDRTAEAPRPPGRARPDCRGRPRPRLGVSSVAEPLAGVGVEDVHVVRVGGDVDRLALVHRVPAGDPDDHVDGVPSTSQVP